MININTEVTINETGFEGKIHGFIVASKNYLIKYVGAHNVAMTGWFNEDEFNEV